MSWFRNHYVCIVCEGHWLAEAAEAQDADCPHCRAYDVVPYRSEDFSQVELGGLKLQFRQTRIKAAAH